MGHLSLKSSLFKNLRCSSMLDKFLTHIRTVSQEVLQDTFEELREWNHIGPEASEYLGEFRKEMDSMSDGQFDQLIDSVRHLRNISEPFEEYATRLSL